MNLPFLFECIREIRAIRVFKSFLPILDCCEEKFRNTIFLIFDLPACRQAGHFDF